MAKFKITFKKEVVEEIELEVETSSIMEALDQSRIRAKEMSASESNISGKTIWTAIKINEIGE